MADTSFEKLSLDEIEKRLNSLESDKVALRRALDEKRQHGKKELAKEIRDTIEAKGYDVAEILEFIQPKRRGALRGKSNRSYTRYVDPANSQNIYIRGVLPGWMKDQMVAKGLNPKDKNDREKFKQDHMEKLDA